MSLSVANNLGSSALNASHCADSHIKNYNMNTIDPREGFFHAMLSYRVDPDQDFVTKIHDKVHLIGHSALGFPCIDSYPWPSAFHRDESVANSDVRLFQDVFCLKNGMGWEGDGDSQHGGFVGALKLSVVFVPLLSAKTNEHGDILHYGSVGRLMDLANRDKQDNVLLELIVARELHLQSKQRGKSALVPCSHILPLFQSKDVWDAVTLLPKQPSAITNSRALQILKSMGISDLFVSQELKSGSLTVSDVLSFYGQFQGIKLYERGSDKYQIEAAAKAIIGVIKDSVSDFNFYDLDQNHAQMYELFEFLSSLNMANYTKILASNKITSVFQLSNLNPNEDKVVNLIAERGIQGSESSLAAELVKVRSAVAAAKSSRLSKSLNHRFRDFIDEDASLATVLQSSSVLDNAFSKKTFVCIVFLVSFYLLITGAVKAASHKKVASDNTDLYFPFNETSRVIFYSCQPAFFLMCCVSFILARFHSPRLGRHGFAFSLFCYCCLFGWVLAASIFSAIENDCQDCANVDVIVTEQRHVILSILNQPSSVFPILATLVCSMIRQDLLVPLSVGTAIFFNSIPGLVFLLYFGTFRSIAATDYFRNCATWAVVVVVLKVLLFVGNRRAIAIYAKNDQILSQAYSKVCSKFECSEGFRDVSRAPLGSGTICSRVTSMFRWKCNNKPTFSRSSLHLLANVSSTVKVLNCSFLWRQELIGEGQIYQLQSSFENLVQDAEFINCPFQEWVSSWLADGPHPDKIKKHLWHNEHGLDAAFTVFFPQNESSIKGTHIRGPVKHVDRAICKAYRSYRGDYKRLTDIVRCALVLESPDDITRIIKKIYENSYISMQNHSGLLRMVNAVWSSFLLRGLGLIPIDGSLDTEIEHSSGAFELLRIRNRFAALNPPGGYRDINIKIRVGFKSDANTGRPLFCPVKIWGQPDVKTMVLIFLLGIATYLIVAIQVVEIQLQLKDLHTAMSQQERLIHRNYIRARNLMSQ